MSRDRELAARLEIAELGVSYCRAIDRCDLALLRSVFWPEATVSYGLYAGPAGSFAELTIDAVRRACQSTMHFLGNALLKLDGDSACGECYVQAIHCLARPADIGPLLADPALEAGDAVVRAAPDAPCIFTVGARYLDRLTRRDAAWRILHRTYVWDWCSIGPRNLLGHATAARSALLLGRRDASDVSYAVLKTHGADADDPR
jgi:hypothetical protein